MSRRRPRGIALITAMLVMAIAAIAAAAVLVSAQMAIRRAGNLMDGEKAWWYANGLESWVRAVLKRDDVPAHDGLEEIWAQPVDYLPVDQGVLRGKIEDLQGRFNLNNFYTITNTVNPDMLGQWQRLFGEIEGLDASQAPAIAEAITDWIDPNSIPIGSGGAEDTEYTSLDLPYRAANQLMKSPTELLAVKGMTPEIYQLLAPYVTALPLDLKAAPVLPTRININTASEQVLMSLSTGMTANASKLGQWLEERKKKPVDTVAEKSDTFPPDTEKFTDTKSQFFLMTGEAFIGSGRVRLYSVLMRPSPGADPIVITKSLDTE